VVSNEKSDLLGSRRAKRSGGGGGEPPIIYRNVQENNQYIRIYLQSMTIILNKLRKLNLQFENELCTTQPYTIVSFPEGIISKIYTCYILVIAQLNLKKNEISCTRKQFSLMLPYYIMLLAFVGHEKLI